MKNFNVLLSRYFVLVMLSLIALGCSQRHISKITINDVVSYPDPPDTARIQYLTSYTTSKDFEPEISAFSKYLFGEEPAKLINKPYGATIHDGNIYVCDLDLPGLEILNLKTNEFSYFIPKGQGKLRLPINCSVDSAGNLFVADVERKQIVVFNKNLEYIANFGLKDKFKPTDVVVKNDKIWVCNLVNGSVDVFKNDSNHTFLYSIPKNNDLKSDISQPTNIWLTDDKLYVSDFGSFKLKIFDLKGNYLSTIGEYGKNIGDFARPKGVAVDKDENIYVVDAAFENVQIFNENGELLLFFGGPTYAPGGMLLPAKVLVNYDHNEYFQKYVFKGYDLKYVILVTNNFGQDRVSIYGRIEIKNKVK